MATLQRLAVSFRRQGSSGPVWDNKYYPGDDWESIMELRLNELRPCKSAKAVLNSRTAFNDINISDAGLPRACPRSLSVRWKFSTGLSGMFSKKVKPGKNEE